MSVRRGWGTQTRIGGGRGRLPAAGYRTPSHAAVTPSLGVMKNTSAEQFLLPPLLSPPLFPHPSSGERLHQTDRSLTQRLAGGTTPAFLLLLLLGCTSCTQLHRNTVFREQRTELVRARVFILGCMTTRFAVVSLATGNPVPHGGIFGGSPGTGNKHKQPTESQNHRIVGVGRDLCGSSSPTPLPKQGHPQQAVEDLVQAGLEYLQRRRLHNLPGQPGPGLRHPQREEVLPHVQTENRLSLLWGGPRSFFQLSSCCLFKRKLTKKTP